MKRIFIFISLWLATTLSLAQVAFPTKPIRIILGSGAGGFADVATRLVAQKLSERLGQAVFVENRPGAGGITGAQAMLAAPPDGHTIFVMVGGNAIAKALLPSLPFDLEKDFAPISTVSFFDLLLLTRKDSPLKTAADIVALAETKPGGVSIGTTSTGSIQSLTAYLLTSTMGIKGTIVPYKTSADIMSGIHRGDVDIGIDAYARLKAVIDSGQLRAVVATGATRSPMQPNVPTMREAGYKGFEVSSWNGFFTAAGTPPSTIATLNKAIRDILATPEMRKRFIDLGAEPRASTPEEAGALLKENIDRWGAVVVKAGIPKQQ
jgi:tripartite-type tricarboxylate transporter receptor subunit TctC